ncbi:hypothetical protein PSHT_00738 [Puccinia striiformis]|uniref:Tet-like 2OG-Fe(II) oxygenase domain-containing protein n=1 Tax=Puccinia striiformis TaxID=27350 RepID=A0A2S4WM87_9BASI|nr:hypothetical protein PSHT_00738 [Puccinia striiformis]
MKTNNLPSFLTPEFTCPRCPHSTPFASNLTATWGEFYNRAHVDNDVSQMVYGGWCNVDGTTGLPAPHSDGSSEVKFGQFYLPGISTIVDFSAIDGWTDMFWASNVLFHQTVKSERSPGSNITRFAFSVQTNKSFFDGDTRPNCRDIHLRKVEQITASMKIIDFRVVGDQITSSCCWICQEHP